MLLQLPSQGLWYVQVLRSVLERQGRMRGNEAHFENTALLFTAVK